MTAAGLRLMKVEYNTLCCYSSRRLGESPLLTVPQLLLSRPWGASAYMDIINQLEVCDLANGNLVPQLLPNLLRTASEKQRLIRTSPRLMNSIELSTLVVRRESRSELVYEPFTSEDLVPDEESDYVFLLEAATRYLGISPLETEDLIKRGLLPVYFEDNSAHGRPAKFQPSRPSIYLLKDLNRIKKAKATSFIQLNNS